MPEDRPITREEEFATCIFEWVKTEQTGTLSKFASFVVENDVEYTCFIDGTRIRTDLIGDVVIRHRDESTLMTIPGERYAMPPGERTYVQAPAPSNPVNELIKKSKKKKEKLSFMIQVELPVQQFYDLMSDSFDDIDTEIVNYATSQIDFAKFVDSVREAIKQKYKKQ
jgi:hypothetical protein